MLFLMLYLTTRDCIAEDFLLKIGNFSDGILFSLLESEKIFLYEQCCNPAPFRSPACKEVMMETCLVIGDLYSNICELADLK